MKDIHTHILFDIDDGAEDIEESVEMCRISYSENVTDIILTPHFYSFDNIDGRLAERDEKIEILRGRLEEEEINIRLYPGAEVLADEDIIFASGLERLTLNNSRYFLMEFQFDGFSLMRAMKYVEHIIELGMVPVIAHAERYSFLQADYEAVNDFLEAGALIQVNAPHMAGHGGRREVKLARELVASGVASFIASDAHSVEYRPPNLLEMIIQSGITLPEDQMRIIMEDNPQMVIDDDPPPDISEITFYSRKRRFML